MLSYTCLTWRQQSAPNRISGFGHRELQKLRSTRFHWHFKALPSPHRMDHGGHPCWPMWHPCCCWHRTFPLEAQPLSPFPSGRLQLHLRGPMDRVWPKSPRQGCGASIWNIINHRLTIINVDWFVPKRLDSARLARCFQRLLKQNPQHTPTLFCLHCAEAIIRP